MIKLTQLNGNNVWISSAHIVSLISYNDGSILTDTSKDSWAVSETPEEIIKLLDA